MKNAIISILLFLMLFIALKLADSNLTALCTTIGNTCEEIEISLVNEDYDTAYQHSVDLLRFMEEKGSIASVYVNHQDYDALINEALRLALYIKQDELGDSFASLHVLRYGARNMRDLQKINIKNLF